MLLMLMSQEEVTVTDAVCQVPVKKVAAPAKDSTAAMAELQDDIGDVLEGESQVASL